MVAVMGWSAGCDAPRRMVKSAAAAGMAAAATAARATERAKALRVGNFMVASLFLGQSDPRRLRAAAWRSTWGRWLGWIAALSADGPLQSPGMENPIVSRLSSNA